MYAQEEDKHFFYHGGVGTICLDNDASEAEVITDTKEIEEGKSLNSLTT